MLKYVYCLVGDSIEENKLTLFFADMSLPLIRIKNPSSLEQLLWIGDMSADNFHAAHGGVCGLLRPMYDYIPNVNDEQIEAIFNYPPLQLVEKNGVRTFADTASRYFNIVDNSRVTIGVPDMYDNTVHITGNCFSMGIFAEDDHTVASLLQMRLNENPIDGRIYRVTNHALFGNLKFEDKLRGMLSRKYNQGDVIFYFLNDAMKGRTKYLKSSRIHRLDLTSLFDRPHNMGEVFIDCRHVGAKGYSLIAHEFHRVLSSMPKNEFSGPPLSRYIIKPFIQKAPPTPMKKEHSESIDKYLIFLKNEASNIEGVIGSVVMNCNPFTIGHRYLIDEAMARCDFLYIFVVEEDKSFFSFQDRLFLVKQGTADLPNVKVLPSGKFIISSYTLPDYFNKEDKPFVAIDASLDAEIFRDMIAPSLGISLRFLGEEPFDPVTKQYNSALLEKLPAGGVEVVVLPRKSAEDGRPISASDVRKLLRENNFSSIAKIVPPSTLEFLRRIYS